MGEVRERGETLARPARWDLIFGIWTAYGLISSLQQYLLGLLYHSPIA